MNFTCKTDRLEMATFLHSIYRTWFQYVFWQEFRNVCQQSCSVQILLCRNDRSYCQTSCLPQKTLFLQPVLGIHHAPTEEKFHCLQ